MSKHRAPRETAEGKAGNLRLKLALPPHVAGPVTTRGLMMDVLIALTPSLLLAGTYFFGPRAFLLVGVSVGGCLLLEWLCCLARHREQTLGDLSAVVTGVLLALCLPPAVPFWALLAGDFFAIVVVKNLFGGLGNNMVNPALGGWIFLCFSPGVRGAFSASRDWSGLMVGLDGLSGATPMAALREGALPTAGLEQMFTGIRGGSLGETSAALLLLGGLYLVLRHVISPRIPLCYLGTVAAISYFTCPRRFDPLEWTAYALMGGGVLLGAIFMATDPVTSPATRRGQTVYGVGCGVLTVLLRRYGVYPEGAAFAIVAMNFCARGLDGLWLPAEWRRVAEQWKETIKSRADRRQ